MVATPRDRRATLACKGEESQLGVDTVTESVEASLSMVEQHWTMSGFADYGRGAAPLGRPQSRARWSARAAPAALRETVSQRGENLEYLKITNIPENLEPEHEMKEMQGNQRR
eukprot:5600037-Pleurochrysis_carterae.AAC.1